MNWTGGTLHRHQKNSRTSALLSKQKEHFARVRKTRNHRNPRLPLQPSQFQPDFLPNVVNESTSNHSPQYAHSRHAGTPPEPPASSRGKRSTEDEFHVRTRDHGQTSPPQHHRNPSPPHQTNLSNPKPSALRTAHSTDDLATKRRRLLDSKNWLNLPCPAPQPHYRHQHLPNPFLPKATPPQNNTAKRRRLTTPDHVRRGGLGQRILVPSIHEEARKRGPWDRTNAGGDEGEVVVKIGDAALQPSTLAAEEDEEEGGVWERVRSPDSMMLDPLDDLDRVAPFRGSLGLRSPPAVEIVEERGAYMSGALVSHVPPDIPSVEYGGKEKGEGAYMSGALVTHDSPHPGLIEEKEREVQRQQGRLIFSPSRSPTVDQLEGKSQDATVGSPVAPSDRKPGDAPVDDEKADAHEEEEEDASEEVRWKEFLSLPSLRPSTNPAAISRPNGATTASAQQPQTPRRDHAEGNQCTPLKFDVAPQRHALFPAHHPTKTPAPPSLPQSQSQKPPKAQHCQETYKDDNNNDDDEALWRAFIFGSPSPSPPQPAPLMETQPDNNARPTTSLAANPSQAIPSDRCSSILSLPPFARSSPSSSSSSSSPRQHKERNPARRQRGKQAAAQRKGQEEGEMSWSQEAQHGSLSCSSGSRECQNQRSGSSSDPLTSADPRFDIRAAGVSWRRS